MKERNRREEDFQVRQRILRRRTLRCDLLGFGTLVLFVILLLRAAFVKSDGMNALAGARFFVAGATGYTGQAVVRRARALGVRTIAHVRADSSQRAKLEPMFRDMGAEVDLTLWDEEAMVQSLRRYQVTHVFALLGTTRKRGKQAKQKSGADETYETIDYGLTTMLLRASERCGSNPRFVYLSSMGVGGQTQNAYLLARHRVETELRASSLSWVIARPSFITGADREESRPLERVGAVVVDGLLGVAGAFGMERVRENYRSITSTALARALVHLALDPNASNFVAAGDKLQARSELSPS